MPVKEQPKNNIEITNYSICESVSNATVPPDGSSTSLNAEVPFDPIVDWIISSDDNATPQGSSTIFTKDIHDDPISDEIYSSADANGVLGKPIIEWIHCPVTDATTTAIPMPSPATATSPPSSTMPQIPRVPGTVREKHDYLKYYAPKVVSIGPYHYGEPKLEGIQKLKLPFALKLLLNNHESLICLFNMLSEQGTVKKLRGYYEENSTTKYTDDVFTKMMILDSCFILYFIKYILKGSCNDCSELKSNEIFLVRRDLFLLENQIPFKVLIKVTNFIMSRSLLKDVTKFIIQSSFVKHRRTKRKWKTLFIGGDKDDEEPDHLLGAVHGKHSMKAAHTTRKINPFKFHGCNFRKVTELADVGIYFKPIKNTLSMTHIEFVKSWSGFSAYVKLPPIAMSDYTRPMLLNLMAYETCRFSINESWVTSYVYLLGYLIDDVDDVKLLRKAWVLENYLVSDKEVVDLFDEIGTDLVENSDEYLEARYKIQKHYECWRNTVFSQLKNEYFKSPWAFFALLGALVALFLTGVQTYFTIWSPKSTCDKLCMFLNTHHHL